MTEKQLQEARRKRAKRKPRKSHGATITYTTGDIQKNIDFFNKRFGSYLGNDNNNPSTEEAKAANAAIFGKADIGEIIGGTGIDNGEGQLDGGESGGEGMGESMKLKEAKRDVRRYYVRPQNIFCANKSEIIRTLIEIGNQNCSVYTLKYLGDEKDVKRLTNKDIIYYYDDGILYDKNRVKVMDYDLYIKHEEERKKFNKDADKVPEREFNQEYDDRITDSTGIEESVENPFELEFEDRNVFGETLSESAKKHVCCICGEEFEGYGNNPSPVKDEGVCCDACNLKFVIPARIENLEIE